MSATFTPPENLPDQLPSPPEATVSRPLPIAPLTAFLLALSIVATLASGLGQNTPVLVRWVISEFDGLGYGIFLPEIDQGQWWRLVSPLFIHFGLPSLVFDLVTLAVLGTLVERGEGKRSLLAQILVLGVVTNFAQFLTSGPVFGGMSGVAYGLLARLWLKSRFDPGSRFRVPGPVVTLMLGWLAVCTTGWIAHPANYAHGVGMGVGALWGVVSAAVGRQRGRVKEE